jgi:1-acyl-sn-glycerol-3-phosphate acyltransferase
VSDQERTATPPTPAWPFRKSVRVVGDTLRDFVVTPFIKHWVSITTEGADNLRDLNESAIFIFNHSDDFDAPVIYAALPRKIRRKMCVATGENILGDHGGLAFVIRLCYAGFSFARRAFRPSLAYVGELMASGHHILLAPEGELSTDGQLAEFKAGIGLLAVTLGAPVVPMRLDGLWGTVPMHALWPKRHSDVTLHIGVPQRFGPVAKYREVTVALHDAVQAL